MALNQTKMKKAPGPDGFTTRYFKHVFKILAPHFTRALNAIDQPGYIPKQTLAATRMAAPKEGKDPSSCSSYRPISLLNIDLNLFTKVLYLCLIPYLSSIVHLDQVGFIPNREARDNTIRVINIIYKASISDHACMLLSTDTNKAFDRVDWLFIEGTLE